MSATRSDLWHFTASLAQLCGGQVRVRISDGVIYVKMDEQYRPQWTWLREDTFHGTPIVWEDVAK